MTDVEIKQQALELALKNLAEIRGHRDAAIARKAEMLAVLDSMQERQRSGQIEDAAAILAELRNTRATLTTCDDEIQTYGSMLRPANEAVERARDQYRSARQREAMPEYESLKEEIPALATAFAEKLGHFLAIARDVDLPCTGNASKLCDVYGEGGIPAILRQHGCPLDFTPVRPGTSFEDYRDNDADVD